MSWYVCLDIGGTSIKHGVADETGKFSITGNTDNCIAVNGINAFLQSLLSIVKEYQKNYNIQGVAFCTAGMVNTKNSCIIRAPLYFPDYAGVNLPAFIQEKINLQATIINDVNAVCLGEYWQGAGQKANSLFCIAFGTGIGGALMLEGKLWEGASYCAGEVGLMQAGEQENWEDLASTAGLIRDMAQSKGCSIRELNGIKIFTKAKEGDSAAVAAIDKMVARWAEGITNICYVVNPQVIVLGGGIMAQADYLLPKLQNALKSILLKHIYDTTNLVCAKLGNRAGMIGALYYFLQEKAINP